MYHTGKEFEEKGVPSLLFEDGHPLLDKTFQVEGFTLDLMHLFFDRINQLIIEPGEALCSIVYTDQPLQCLFILYVSAQHTAVCLNGRQRKIELVHDLFCQMQQMLLRLLLRHQEMGSDDISPPHTQQQDEDTCNQKRAFVKPLVLHEPVDKTQQHCHTEHIPQ